MYTDPNLNTHLHWVKTWVESHQPGCNSGCDQNERKVFSGSTQYGARLQTTYLCLDLKLEDLWGYIYNGITCECEVIIVLIH